MKNVFVRLYAASSALAGVAALVYRAGARQAHEAASAGVQTACEVCFGAGDGLKAVAGLLCVAAASLAFAATALWLRERRGDAGRPLSITNLNGT